MKPNVDLTENRLFTTFENREFSEIHMLLIKSLKLNMPWRKMQEVSSDNELCNSIENFKKHSYFPTGNKHERQKKIESRMYYENRCEECDQPLPKCPWIRHNCSAYCMTLEKRIPWIF